MDKVIIYVVQDGDYAGNLAVVYPTNDSNLTIEQIAAKDVPNGIAYKIVDKSQIPENRENRKDWKLEDFN